MDGVRVTTVVGHERLQRVKVPKKGENEERGGGGEGEKGGGGFETEAGFWKDLVAVRDERGWGLRR